MFPDAALRLGRHSSASQNIESLDNMALPNRVNEKNASPARNRIEVKLCSSWLSYLQYAVVCATFF